MATTPSSQPAPALRRRPTPALVLLVSGLIAVLGLLSTPTVIAQESTERHGIFIDTIDVNLINIEVVVTDEEGNPVRALTRDDFEVYVDDQPVEITNFFAVVDGDRVAPEPGATSGTETPRVEAPEAVETSQTPLRTPEERRYVVLYIDNGNIAPLHRKRVFDELRDHLGHLMEPADRVMVVAQDDEITIEQPFTSDAEMVLAAIERQEKVSGRGAMRALEPRLIQRQIEEGQTPPGGDTLGTGTSPNLASASGTARTRGRSLARPTYDVDARRTFSTVTSYAQTTENAGRHTLAGLSRFVSSLAGLPGRKAIVYVSDGLDLAPGEYLFRVWDYKYGSIANEEVGIANIESEMDRYRLHQPFEDLIARANANRVAFYTIEGGSERGSGDISAETSTPVVSALARTADGGRQESLRSLAYDTGGVPLVNSANVETLLRQLERDFSNYYSLGFPSPHQGDGEYHRVDVRVAREGVEARFLEGYRDKNADDRMTDQTLAILLHDVGENPLGVQVEIGKQSKAKGKKGYLVPVLVKVPMSKLMLLPQEDEHLGRLSIYIAVADDRGRLSEPQKIDVPVRIPNEKLLGAMSQTAAYAAQIQMREGEQKLAVGVRDDVAAVGSTLNLNVQVGGG